MPRIASSAYIPQLIAVSATCGVLATVAWATKGSYSVAAAEMPVPVIETTDVLEPVRVVEIAAVKQPAPPPAPSNQLLFVFRAGGETYAKISADDELPESK
jgi:hypothetical protein